MLGLKMDLGWHVKKLAVRAAVWLLKSTGWYEGYYAGWRGVFEYAERRGLHVLPVHHYTPVPDTRTLANEHWNKDRHLPAINCNITNAAIFVFDLISKYRIECEALPRGKSICYTEYSLDNEAFGRGDADVLYSIIREYKPKKIVEIGSGYSTLLMCRAIRANLEESLDNICELLAIEPYPPPFLVPPPSAVTHLEAAFVQDVPLSVFESLKANDILFIDSSHTVKIGSDTIYEILSILPVLAPGVLVHVHDIFTPFDYPRKWTKESCFFWNEQYMLEAFLCFNKDFEVIAPLHALSEMHPEKFLSRELTDPNIGSFWIRRITS